MTVITLANITEGTLEGAGAFDTLMRANKLHLENEFQAGRIKGTEYASVYLGSLESVMRTSMEFLLQREKVALEAELVGEQIVLAKIEAQKAQAELAILQANLPKVAKEMLQIDAQILQINAQTALTNQQKSSFGRRTVNCGY